MEDFERRLLAAQGYCELSMHDDALTELDALDAEWRARPEALEMRTLVLMQAKRWKEASQSSQRLCKAAPESGAGWVHLAFCLHEMGYSAEARATLLAGPASLKQEPVFFYNLACYECQLGNLDGARTLLEKSFEMDKKYREFARTDPDLAPLRPTSPSP